MSSHGHGGYHGDGHHGQHNDGGRRGHGGYDSHADHGKDNHRASSHNSTTLKVAVWNAAGSAGGKYQHERDPVKAAEYFMSTHHGFVLCPESDSKTWHAFQAVGYKTDLHNHDLALFYYSEFQKSGDHKQMKVSGGEGHQHTGKALCQMFSTSDGTKILVTAVHGGHYGKPSHPEEDSALRAVGEVRSLQESMGADRADKVIVGGDFNELGQCMHNYYKVDPTRFSPLPDCVDSQVGSPHVGKTETMAHFNGMFDHIWVGGRGIGRPSEARAGETFGSDHKCVTMWGI